MDSVDLLYDHYKESFALNKTAQNDRDRYIIILGCLIGLLFLFSVNPQTIAGMLQGFCKDKWNVDIKFSINILQSFMWLILLFFTIRYYQKVIYVERLYNYIHKLESVIAEESHLKTFDRESTDYLGHYPAILDFLHIIYQTIFPVLYLGVILYKIITEWINHTNIICTILNTILSSCIITLSILYLFFLISKKPS
jgi:hypothetical protein